MELVCFLKLLHVCVQKSEIFLNPRSLYITRVPGKSTLLNMLTGILPLTSGQSSIYGLDLGSDLSNIRKLFGTWYIVVLCVLY